MQVGRRSNWTRSVLCFGILWYWAQEHAIQIQEFCSSLPSFLSGHLNPTIFLHERTKFLNVISS